MLLLKTPFLILTLYICSRNKHVHKAPPKAAEDDASQSLRPLGIANLGHTCFMNSVLQSLFSASAYRNQVLSHEYRERSVGYELKRLFRSMDSDDSWFADPRRLARALGINVWRQQDAEELLLDLVNRVDSSVEQKESENEIENESENGRLPSAEVRFDSYQSIECLHVNHTKHKVQRNLDLSIDIKGHSNLQDALRAHFVPEYLTGENQYHTKEHGSQDARRLLSLTKPAEAAERAGSADAVESVMKQGDNKQSAVLPEVLVLHLKRFAFDPETSSMCKVGDPVDIPLTLNLSGLSTATSSASVAMNMNSVAESVTGSREELQQRVQAIATGLLDPPTTVIQDQDQEQGQHTGADVRGSVETSHDEYTLSSIVVHKGTLDSGHYYTLCRVPVTENSCKNSSIIGTCSAPNSGVCDPDSSNICERNNEPPRRFKWLKFNDHVVTEVSEEVALSKARGRITSKGASKNAYLVFYTRNR